MLKMKRKKKKLTKNKDKKSMDFALKPRFLEINKAQINWLLKKKTRKL